MNYKDIEPPMTDDEWQSTRKRDVQRQRKFAAATFALAGVAFAFCCAVLLPLLGWPSQLPVVVSGSWWYLAAMLAGVMSVVWLSAGFKEWPWGGVDEPATGRMLAEATELDEKTSAELFQLATDVPEIHDLVSAWYDAGRTMNVRALDDLKRVKALKEEAEADAQLQASIAARFTAKASA